MKGKKLFEKIEDVREEFVQDTAESLYGTGKQHKKIYKSFKYIFVVAAVAALCILASGIKGNMQKYEKEDKVVSLPDNNLPVASGSDNSGNENKKSSDSTSADSKKYKVKRLQRVVYPDKDNLLDNEDLEPDKNYLKNLKPFYQQTISNIMTGADDTNMAYSPVNLYLCMAMLAEVTDGQTQKQLLDALGQESINNVGKQSKNIWNSIYRDNNISKCILGDSIWLNDNVNYDKDVLKILADNYYASTHQGKMGTKSMDKAIQNWVNNMTGNVLNEQAGSIETSPQTAFMLLSSACFYDQWSTTFNKEYTKKAIFYNADGSTTQCDFMKRIDNRSFYKRDRFSAVTLGFESGLCMTVFLPDKEASLEEILQKDIEEILDISTKYKGEKYGKVTLLLPKFQITTSHLDLIPIMQDMGITDIFKPGNGFEKFVDKNQMDSLFVDKVQQSTKVAIDENGCSIASYTEVGIKDGGGIPDEKFKLNCNRPFLFIISDVYNEIPIFAGVINEME